MRRLLTRLGGLAAAALLTAGPVPPAQAAEPAYFVITDVTQEEMVLRLDDPAKIEHARDLLNGATGERPHVVGRIVKSQADYNPRWSFHYDPGTVDFFEAAIEICDATIPYVEDHLDEAGGAFLPGLVWCPWTSRVVREIPAP
ncbi:BP74-related protein [Streptomyces sp. enrichment culture]|uniref:BP74-related protein n=1 Tax=Streptomyces sp. enrichment culture TaxID=1795815 RepID=UPI003F5474B5